jgi:putative membrane protein
VAVEAGAVGAPDPPRRTGRLSRFMLRAPSSPTTLGLIVAASGVLAVVAWSPGGGIRWLVELWLGAFLLPALLASTGTGPLAGLLGGRLVLRRSLLLAFTSLLLVAPLLLLWRLLTLIPAVDSIPVPLVLLWTVGPMLWLRQMSLYGVSNADHARSLPAAVLQPAAVIAGVFLLAPPSIAYVVATAGFLVLGFLCVALLIRTTERPIRREFGVSGMSLIRPILDHINERDPAATQALEAFFARRAIPANLRVGLISFRAGDRVKATIALPTVHPGPFASLGASDLPRKLTEAVGSAGGTVFVPHTPCDHDLDLPTAREVERVAEALRGLAASATTAVSRDVSPLVRPHEGSIARAQLLGDTVLVLVTQAPAPTDDIAYAVADRLVREYERSGGPRLSLIDAHNSYIEDQGDVAYGTPIADRLMADVRAAVAEALRRKVPGPAEVGTAERTGYSIGTHGIGPQGIRALAVRAGGRTAAYVLIDGNNLLTGMRQAVLDRLVGVVDDAEVMTTDNHIVHEVDGGINPVGERYGVEALASDVRALVAEAVQDLTRVEVASGIAEVPDVPVLGPGYTARLLTSLGDTLSVFANAFLTTFLLLVASSSVVVAALR